MSSAACTVFLATQMTNCRHCDWVAADFRADSICVEFKRVKGRSIYAPCPLFKFDVLLSGRHTSLLGFDNPVIVAQGCPVRYPDFVLKTIGVDGTVRIESVPKGGMKGGADCEKWEIQGYEIAIK